MDNKFNNGDFEHFIKENADQYRMFPSEKVWKGIHKTVHTRTRWYGFGLGILILTISAVTWVMLSTSNRNRPVISSLPSVTIQQEPKELIEPAQIALAPAKPLDNKLGFVSTNKTLQKEFFIETSEITEDYPSASVLAISAIQEPLMSISEVVSILKNESSPVNEHVTARLPSLPKQQVINKIPEIAVTIEKPMQANLDAPVETDKHVAVKEDFLRNRVHDAPWTIESVINSYRHSRRNRKFSLEASITPTITYRELRENKPFISWARNQTSGLNNATYTPDVDNIVKHKPDLGLQLGLTGGLPLSKRVRVVAGVQFNVSKYDIRAYTTPAEQATVSLSSAAGRMNTLTATSYYRNVGGPTPNWLRNLYISASLPVGLEVKVFGNTRNYFGVKGTVQPTYILSNNSYLLTTDYKNYAKFPSLTRKVNVNGGFEMFAGLKTGNLNWRIGPQVRYQVMSSYQDRYPIMEHLFDYGIKMGIMLNK